MFGVIQQKPKNGLEKDSLFFELRWCLREGHWQRRGFGVDLSQDGRESGEESFFVFGPTAGMLSETKL